MTQLSQKVKAWKLITGFLIDFVKARKNNVCLMQPKSAEQVRSLKP